MSMNALFYSFQLEHIGNVEERTFNPKVKKKKTEYIYDHSNKIATLLSFSHHPVIFLQLKIATTTQSAL